jgi:hypothetical protein
MAIITKYRKFLDQPKQLYLKPESGRILSVRITFIPVFWGQIYIFVKY